MSDSKAVPGSEAQNQFVFYDIASQPPLRTFAANPWKTRFALNYKRINYRTQWIDMPDISSVRQELGVPANRTLPDGTPYHTLPVVVDGANNQTLGDTFEIALYLDRTYPDQPKLFHPLSAGLTAAFNAHVDGIFTKYVTLCTQMPFDPRVEGKVKEIFAKRAKAMSLDTLELNDELLEQSMVSFEAALAELAKAYRHTGGTTDYFWSATGTADEQRQRPPPERTQPCAFLDGTDPVYADFIVGAWLKMMEASMAPARWKRVRTWQGGLWGSLVDALDRWAEIK